MKKLTVLLLSMLLLLCACGEYTQYQYVTAGQSVELFSCFDAYGGVVESAEFTLDYEAYLTVSFPSEDKIQSSIKAINVAALDEQRYDKGQRVMEIKSRNGKTVVVYVANVNALKSRAAEFCGGQFFKENLMENYQTTEFSRVNSDKFAIENMKDKAVVLQLEQIPPNTLIKIKGNIVSSTVLGREKVTNNTVLYTTTDAVIILEKSYTLLVIILAASLLLVLVGIFLLFVKFRVFTKLKIKKVKGSGENE